MEPKLRLAVDVAVLLGVAVGEEDAVEVGDGDGVGAAGATTAPR